MKIDFAPTQSVTIDYTNWRGERRTRTIWPHEISFGSNEYHPEPQWLLSAVDADTDSMRTFALKDIHEWTQNAASK